MPVTGFPNGDEKTRMEDRLGSHVFNSFLFLFLCHNSSLSFIIWVIGKDYEWSNCFPFSTHTNNIQPQSQILLLNLHYIILSQFISSIRSNIIQVQEKIINPPQGSFSELVSNRATDLWCSQSCQSQSHFKSFCLLFLFIS